MLAFLANCAVVPRLGKTYRTVAHIEQGRRLLAPPLPEKLLTSVETDAYTLRRLRPPPRPLVPRPISFARSEEHTSELQSLMRISYAVFCLKKKNINNINIYTYRLVSNYIHRKEKNNNMIIQ